jgi:hypothetical protein
MKKTSVLLVLGLALVLASVAAPKANAGVVFGVAISAPVYPVHAYGYVGPRYYARGYVAPAYVAPGPYVAYGPRPIYRRYYAAPRPYFYGGGRYERRFEGHRDFYRDRR